MPQVTASQLKSRRVSRGLTLDALAKACTKAGAPTSESAISRIERGIHTPRPALRKAIADALDLDVTYFDQEAS